MKKIVLGLAVLPFLVGFGSKHSSLTTTSKVVGDELVLQFKIEANKGMQLTHDAPWSITLSNFGKLELEQKDGKFVSRAYDKSLPGFTIKTKASGSTGTLDYKMRAFVCTEDKTLCYPQSHAGSVQWNKS